MVDLYLNTLGFNNSVYLLVERVDGFSIFPYVFSLSGDERPRLRAS